MPHAAGTTPKDLQPLDGVDLVPYLTRANESAPHKTLYWSMEAPNASHWAVRDLNMKLIYEDIHPETMSDPVDLST